MGRGSSINTHAIDEWGSQIEIKGTCNSQPRDRARGKHGKVKVAGMCERRYRGVHRNDYRHRYRQKVFFIYTSYTLAKFDWSSNIGSSIWKHRDRHGGALLIHVLCRRADRRATSRRGDRSRAGVGVPLGYVALLLVPYCYCTGHHKGREATVAPPLCSSASLPFV